MRRLWMIALLLSASAAANAAERWQDLGHGLELAEFEAPQLSLFGDSKITVLRVDPARAHFKLLSAAALHEAAMPAQEWARRYRLRAVINAGMFGPDRLPVGYMRIGDTLVNGTLGKQNTVFAFDSSGAGLPRAQVIDRTCQDFPALARRYGGLFQSLRMVDCHGRITWAKQSKKWSMAVLGMDRLGRILFIHARSPYSVHQFAEMLLQLPLQLGPLMYLEGGPEATLYIHAGGVQVEKIGSYETGFFESNDNDHAWDLPNVLAVVEEK